MSKKDESGNLQGVTRREFISSSGAAMMLVPIASLSWLGSCSGGSKESTAVTPPASYTGTDEQLLDEVEKGSFQFFWEQAHPDTGLIKDRAKTSGSDNYTVASIASVGFGLTALCIGDKRGYIPSDQIKARVRLTLQTMLSKADGHEGFFYHFLDWSTGKRAWNCELSSIDTALMLCGVLTARQYFASDAQIVDLATKLYNNVNWPWMQNGGKTLTMGWKPESGFLDARWEHYCELMMIYLLAIGSPTHPIAPDTWKAWTRPTYTYQGITYISSGDPLFTHQFSHIWYDFRNKRDDYADYFDNSVKATKAHKLFCLSLHDKFSDYTDSLWGFTASDSMQGYTAWGGPPAMGPIDGSIVPAAAGGSLPFLYDDCMKVLRTVRGGYPNAWCRYGYIDVFNPLKNWYNPDVIGIDVGPTMLMAENKRTNFVWETFMKNPEATRAMQLAGFKVTA
ncbi:conserved hypothetical protein [Candidatus Koribacter versatilis Ellin345]|uniref:Glycoamylase-like domain-containing protein n=1 Tax=Koribacter versatilis (strain Ellin345) TaxID=204669 RepID=Q1IUB4_KORVE|nr:glucoamylase family protein [Candidatus Koribacter versatilis]ABF39536.1 conserved hypothetical protein [Candidatus Koribacter versatilis Ellin345]